MSTTTTITTTTTISTAITTETPSLPPKKAVSFQQPPDDAAPAAARRFAKTEEVRARTSVPGVLNGTLFLPQPRRLLRISRSVQKELYMRTSRARETIGAHHSEPMFVPFRATKRQSNAPQSVAFAMPTVLVHSSSSATAAATSPPPRTRTGMLLERADERRRSTANIIHGARLPLEREFVGYRYIPPAERPTHRVPPGGHTSLVLV